MSSTMFAPTVLFLLVVVASCYSKSDEQNLAKANNEFCVSLLKQLTSEKTHDNVFFSPTSISTALAMIYAGAGGLSKKELSKVLGQARFGLTDRNTVIAAYKKLLAGTNSGNVTLDIANFVLIENRLPVLDSFKKTLTESFGAELRSVNFANDGPRVQSQVNEWVRQKTGGKILSMVDDGFPMNTAMLLLNAVYFNATWHDQFPEKNTVPRSFFNRGSEEVHVKTMAFKGPIRHTSLDGLKAQAVELPYQGEEYSMVIVLPNAKMGLSQLREGLTVSMLQKITNQMSAKTVSLTLPKFELQTNYDLIPTLKQMGLKSVFDEKSDFSGITGDKSLSVSGVRHKAMVEVNEKGTVAAAVTSISMRMGSSLASRIVNFHVDRPFLFYIRNRATGRLLFMGEVHQLQA
ncbi:intracellular coagulation inhibitor 1 [Ixodes scapularis]|nr:intracellular coagulation inhibitor 1 [Ixodes scapularis]